MVIRERMTRVKIILGMDLNKAPLILYCKGIYLHPNLLPLFLFPDQKGGIYYWAEGTIRSNRKAHPIWPEIRQKGQKFQ